MVRQWQELFWDHRYSSQVDTGPLARLRQARRRLRRDRDPADREGARWSHDMREALATIPGRSLVDVRVVTGGERLPDDPAPGQAARDMSRLGGWASRQQKTSCRSRSSRRRSACAPGRKHILSILVENKPGVLTRITGLFTRRGFNIDTLAVRAHRRLTRISRITLTLDGAASPDRSGHQAVAQARQRAQDPRPGTGRDARA